MWFLYVGITEFSINIFYFILPNRVYVRISIYVPIWLYQIDIPTVQMLYFVYFVSIEFS